MIFRNLRGGLNFVSDPISALCHHIAFSSAAGRTSGFSAEKPEFLWTFRFFSDPAHCLRFQTQTAFLLSGVLLFVRITDQSRLAPEKERKIRRLDLSSFLFCCFSSHTPEKFCPYSRAAASPLRGRSLSFSENYSDTGIYLQRQDPGISYRRVCRIPSFLSQSFPGAIRQLPGVPPFLDLRALCERIPPDPWQGT